MQPRVSEDLESLSKDLYLESPDLWIEFSDRVNDNIFDELVLFFACKYNYMSIVNHTISNNLINLNIKSKNREFNTIYNHLLYVAKQNKDKEIYNYLLNISKPSPNSKNTKIEETKPKETENNYNFPTLLCRNCNSNVFEKGYIVLENKTFSFSTEKNKPIEISKEVLSTVSCASCKAIMPSITPSKIEALCNANACSQCASDLRSVGVIDKKVMTYNKNSDSFTASKSDYVCANCNTPLNKKQKQTFNL